MRPMMSVGPAGANGTTRRMVRSGYLACARDEAGRGQRAEARGEKMTTSHGLLPVTHTSVSLNSSIIAFHDRRSVSA
jgi:hypothetical protein